MFLSEKLNLKIHAASIFLEVAKAFNYAWHEGLTYKVIQFGFPVRLIRLIYCCLCGRSFRVHINNILSAIVLFLKAYFGSMSLVLYFSSFFNHSMFTTQLSCSLCGRYIYLCIRAPLIYRYLPTDLDSFINWCELWSDCINEGKMSAVFFSRKLIYPCRLKMNVPLLSLCLILLSTLGSYLIKDLLRIYSFRHEESCRNLSCTQTSF